jgi:hypothetical protein
MSDSTGRATVVVGASRDLGRGIGGAVESREDRHSVADCMAQFDELNEVETVKHPPRECAGRRVT